MAGIVQRCEVVILLYVHQVFLTLLYFVCLLLSQLIHVVRSYSICIVCCELLSHLARRVGLFLLSESADHDFIAFMFNQKLDHLLIVLEDCVV